MLVRSDNPNSREASLNQGNSTIARTLHNDDFMIETLRSSQDRLQAFPNRETASEYRNHHRDLGAILIPPLYVASRHGVHAFLDSQILYGGDSSHPGIWLAAWIIRCLDLVMIAREIFP